MNKAALRVARTTGPLSSVITSDPAAIPTVAECLARDQTRYLRTFVALAIEEWIRKAVASQNVGSEVRSSSTIARLPGFAGSNRRR